MNQTNFLAELHTRTAEQAALEEQANEEFHEDIKLYMQRQAQERDLKVSALAEQQKTCQTPKSFVSGFECHLICFLFSRLSRRRPVELLVRNQS